ARTIGTLTWFKIGEAAWFSGKLGKDLVAGRDDGLYIRKKGVWERDPSSPREPALSMFDFGGESWLATERGIYLRVGDAWRPKFRVRDDESAIKKAFAHGDRLYVIRDGVLWDWTPGPGFADQGEERDPITEAAPGTILGGKKRTIFSTLLSMLGAGFPE